jgi:GGDEF domain-containing protein
VARTANRDGGVAVAVVRIENLAEVESTSDPVKLSRVVQRLVESLRAHVRDFDVVGRCATDRFAVLMPEPGQDPGRRLLALARAVAEDVSKDEALNSPVRIALGFGYSVHPADGRDAESLLAVASNPRIHMV